MDSEVSVIQPDIGLRIISLNCNEVEWAPATKQKNTEVVVPSGKSFFELAVVNVRRGSFIFDGGRFGFELELKKDHKYSIVFKDIVSYHEIELLIVDNTSGVGKITRARQTDTLDMWDITY